MTIKYQIVLIGNKSPFIKSILDTLFHHINELGISAKSILVVDESNFSIEYKANSPTFCLYFGHKTVDFENLDILEVLRNGAKLILPIVSDLKLFTEEIPQTLWDVNGTDLHSVQEVEKVVSYILEGFGLLRVSRRLFISYKRNESTAVAIQLFEQFEKNGFDVFLDTHSIRPTEPFQEELWHRMVDTDVVVLLNTNGFLKSHWTTQELAKANSMSIGVLQLIWPDHKLERDAEISMPMQLIKRDFSSCLFLSSRSRLNSATINKIVNQVESLRARTLASRQANIISEFMSAAKKTGRNATLQYERFIVLEERGGDEVIIIPTVGLPQAFTYQQSEDIVDRIKSKKIAKAYLLYDHVNIREKWLEHLKWLDSYLKTKSIKVIDAETWLTRI